mmetsp:Transcript_36060/g.84190  ORF Transcript_36060/g.84190 Transcript_36060/m.84190 type:complete len:334 (-) Transcript_36060:3429-4430(-)
MTIAAITGVFAFIATVDTTLRLHSLAAQLCRCTSTLCGRFSISTAARNRPDSTKYTRPLLCERCDLHDFDGLAQLGSSGGGVGVVLQLGHAELMLRLLEGGAARLVLCGGRRPVLEQPTNHRWEAFLRKDVQRGVAKEGLCKRQVRSVPNEKAERCHLLLCVIAQVEDEEGRLSLARGEIHRLGVLLEDHFRHLASAVCHCIVQRREPLLEPVVAARVSASFHEQRRDRRGGRADDVGPRRHVVKDGRAIGGLGVRVRRSHIPPIRALVHSIGVATQLEEAAHFLDPSRQAIPKHVGGVAGLEDACGRKRCGRKRLRLRPRRTGAALHRDGCR